MAKEAVFIQDGDRIDFLNETGADIGVGEVLPMVSRIGVPMTNIVQNDIGAVKVTGVFEVPAVTGTAFAVGDAVYWNDTSGYVTTTATGNTPAGFAIAPKLAAGTTALVKIG